MFDKVIDTSAFRNYYRGSSWTKNLYTLVTKRLEPKTKNQEKNSTKRTVPRRRFFLFSIESCSKQQLMPDTEQYKKHSPISSECFLYMIMSSWWSCRVLPPGPKGNLLFVYKYSPHWVLRSIQPQTRAKMTGESRCKMSPMATAA